MGKSYVESSLKRFLKRKIKITLGVVVSFLITGAVSFGADKPTSDIEYRDIFTAEKWIAGYGTENKYPKISIPDAVTITSGGKIQINGVTDPIQLSGISNKTAEVIQTMGKVMANLEIAIEDIVSANPMVEEMVGYVEGFDNSEANNKGLSTSAKKYNYGIINGQQAISNAYNYGIIYHTGSNSQMAVNGNAYNYGLIISSADLGQTINNGTGYNYGVIANSKTAGQYIWKGGIGYNYGIIVNGQQTGQKIGVSNTTGIGYNYGIIANGGNFGQNIETKDSKGYNYGVIKNRGNYGQSVEKDAIGYNYGIIANDGDYAINIANTGAAVNYGVLNNGTDKTEIKFINGDIKNYGISILQADKNLATSNHGLGGINDFGVLVDSKYDLQTVVDAEHTPTDLSKGGDINDNDTEETYYTHNTQVTIGGDLTNKHLTGIKSDSTTDALYTFGAKGIDGELTLTDSTVVGYFADNAAGALLNVYGDLTLDNTIINAVTDLGNYGNVTALNLNGGTLTQKGSSEVVGKITGVGGLGYVSSTAKNQSIDITGDITLANETGSDTDISYSEIKADNLILNFTEGDTNINNIDLKNAVLESIDGKNSDKTINLTIDSTENIGNIVLGSADDTLSLKNGKLGEEESYIDMGAGDDKINLNLGAVGATHKKEAGNTFNYKVKNTEEIVLNGDGWHIGEDAELLDKDGTKADSSQSTKLVVAANSSLHVEMNNDFGKGKTTTSLDKMAEGGNLTLSTEDTSSTVKFVVGEKFNVAEKVFDVATDYKVETDNVEAAVIFDAEKINDGDIRLTVKEAGDLGLENYKGIYDAVLGNLSENDELRNAVNYETANRFVNMITTAGDTASAFYTTGYAVTKDVTDTYMSVVDDFGRKAGKGEWLAYGKYISSDTEFDGGNMSKGYDGDITGTVGMIEYGVSDTTSYGAVYGQGDTEVKINGGSKLDGDNRYFGGFVKHRTANGIDLLGNIGFTKSELDLDLASTNSLYDIISSGSSDAEALTLSLKGKKDFAVDYGFVVQPVAGIRYSLITQDAITSSDANFRMDEQDITIFEGLAGGNILKEFDVYQGKVTLSAGAQYVLCDVNKSDDARYTLFGKEITLSDEEDIADSRIEGHIGAAYIHENGIGVEAKYEMIWTDKGDSSRVTAGLSYKF